MRNRAAAYTTRWMELLRGVDPYTHSQNDPLHMPPITGMVEWEWGAFNLTAGAVVELNITRTDLIRMNNLVHGNLQLPTNFAELETAIWSDCVSNFASSPYAYIRTAGAFGGLLVDKFWRTGVRSDYSTVGESFRWELSPYTGGLFKPSNPYTPSLGRFTCDGLVNRPFRAFRAKPTYIQQAPHVAGGGFGTALHALNNWNINQIAIAHDPYNHLVACPLLTYLMSALIKNQYGTNGAQRNANNHLIANWGGMTAAQRCVLWRRRDFNRQYRLVGHPSHNRAEADTRPLVPTPGRWASFPVRGG